jgi:type III pantothenate kinase
MEVAKSVVIDIGNTRSKMAVFEGGELQQSWVITDFDLSNLRDIIQRFQPNQSILSSVGIDIPGLKQELQEQTRFFELTHRLPTPFTNQYLTPETLGMDRVAAVAGALHFFEHQNCLVLDMGTCITYDFVTAESNYLGGAIAPGLRMRLLSMAKMTSRLPELDFELPSSFIGNTTKTSMLSGVYYGLLGEINQTIERYEEQFGEVKVLMCGGDAPLFDKHTKKSIFAAPDLVLYGLNKLLQYNAT